MVAGLLKSGERLLHTELIQDSSDFKYLFDFRRFFYVQI